MPISTGLCLIFEDDQLFKVFPGTIFCDLKYTYPMPDRIFHSYTFEMAGEHESRTGRYEQEKLSRLTRDIQSSKGELFAIECNQCSLGGSRMKTIHQCRVDRHYLYPF